MSEEKKELYKEKDLKEAYLTGKISDFLDELMIKYELSIEDIGQIKQNLDEIKEKQKTTMDVMMDVFKDDIVVLGNTEFLNENDMKRIAVSLRIVSDTEEKLTKYLQKEKDKNGRTYTLTPDEAGDYSLAILTQMTNLELYEEHWSRKYRDEKNEYITKHHMQRKTAEDLAQGGKAYAEYIKIHIRNRNLTEIALQLKAKSKNNY